MVTSVKLPKQVAIHNSRLAFVHYSGYGCTLVWLVWYKFIIGNEASVPIPIQVQMGIRWDESESIHAMENYFAGNPHVEQLCQQAPYTNFSGHERWGFTWPRRAACTNMCALTSVIDHSSWDSVWRAPSLPADTTAANCWADYRDFGRKQRYTALQFMQSYGEQDVVITTSKDDWIVDHRLHTHRNKIETVPQAEAAVLRVEYRYALLSEPGWFPFVQQNPTKSLKGSNTNAQTVIVDVRKKVVRVIEPGGDIKFTVKEVVSWSSESVSDGVISDQLGSGSEFNLEISCFGSRFDIEKHFGGGVIPDYGPTLDKPVCTLEVTMVSPYYQVAVHYVIPEETQNSLEVVSETKGYYFKCIPGHGVASAWDGNALLISLSSMLVFLALPKRCTSIVASWMLGSLSEMYRRAIVEPYDIERAVAAAATVIAANMSAFHTLNQPSNKSGTGVSPTGESADLTAVEIQKVLAEAMEYRKSDMDDREVASLACFVFEGIKQRRASSNAGLGAAVGDFLGFDFDLINKVRSGSAETHSGITLDQWNQVRMDGEKITFDAVVKLFDKDRRRHLAESFFTPPHIKQALARAADSSAFIPGVSDSFELVHEHVAWYQFPSDHSTADDPATNSVQRTESHASAQNACVARVEIDSPGIEPVHDPMDVEVPPFDEMLREVGLISARGRTAEERLRAALGKGPHSVGTEDISMGQPMLQDTAVSTCSSCATPRLTEETRREPFKTRGAISRSASVSSEHELSTTRGASSRCEHVPYPAARASSNAYLDDVEVSARPLYEAEGSAYPMCEARLSASIGYPGGGAKRQDALPALHTDAGARITGAAGEQRPSPPKAHLAEQPAAAQFGGDWPVAMARALREAPGLADEYPGLPEAALRDITLSEASSLRGSSGAAPRTRASRRGSGAADERSSCTAAAGGAGALSAGLASGACSRAGREGGAELQQDGAATVAAEVAPSQAVEHANPRLLELIGMVQEQADIRRQLHSIAEEIRDHARVPEELLNDGAATAPCP